MGMISGFCWKLVIIYNVLKMLYLYLSTFPHQAALYGCGCWAENTGAHNPYSTAVSTSGICCFHDHFSLLQLCRSFIDWKLCFYVNTKYVLRHLMDQNIDAWKIFDTWVFLRIVSQHKYHSINGLLTFSIQLWG